MKQFNPPPQGNATPADVAAGKTFTSAGSFGVKTGTASDTFLNVGEPQVTPTPVGNNLRVSFTIDMSSSNPQARRPKFIVISVMNYLTDYITHAILNGGRLLPTLAARWTGSSYSLMSGTIMAAKGSEFIDVLEIISYDSGTNVLSIQFTLNTSVPANPVTVTATSDSKIPVRVRAVL